MSRYRGFLFAPLAILALVSAAEAARVQHAVTFDPGSANTFFNGTLGASGTLTLGFTGSVNISTPEILGTPISITAPLVIPNQAVAITSVPNPFNFSVDPTGTMTLDLEKSPETFFGAFPNTADSLRDAEIPDLDVTLVGPSGLAVNTNEVTVTGSATVDILGITSIDFPLTANITAQALLANIMYSQTGSAFVPTDGTVTIPPLYAGEPDGSQQTSYSNIISAGSGSLETSANATGDVTVDLGIFGSITQDLGTIPLLENEVLALDTLALIFSSMRLRDLEPGVYNNTPRNISARLNGNLDLLGGPVELAFNESFNQALSLPFSFDVDLGALGTVTLDGTLSGNLVANIDALFALSDVSFGFEDQVVVDVLVPEPTSIALASLGLVALVPVVWRSRRKSA